MENKIHNELKKQRSYNELNNALNLNTRDIAFLISHA